MDKRALIGRRIVAVHLRPFSDGRGGTAYDPVLVLDDGSRVSFDAQPTEDGDYGITFRHQPPQT